MSETDDRIRYLREEEGYTVEAISHDLERSHPWVTERMRDLGLNPSDRSPRKTALKNKAVQLMHEGLTNGQIGKDLKVPGTTIARWIKAERQEEYRIKVESVCKLGREGKTHRAISDELGIPGRTVARILSDNGISTSQNQSRTVGNHNKKDRYWDQVVSLHNHGWSPYKISQELGLFWQTVKTWLCDEGYDPHPETVGRYSGNVHQKETPSNREILEEFLSGTPASTVDRKFKLEPGTTRDLALENNVYDKGGRYAQDEQKKKTVIREYKNSNSIERAMKVARVGYYKALIWLKEEGLK